MVAICLRDSSVSTARDWARFGLLYAQDGSFGGIQLLPEGWVAKSAVPHPDSRGRCGLHVWLNADPDGDGPAERPWPELPADLLRMDGHEGQYVVVFPKTRTVVVRLLPDGLEEGFLFGHGWPHAAGISPSPTTMFQAPVTLTSNGSGM